MVLARWEHTAVDDAGNRLDQPTVRVEREIAGLPLAVLYADKTGTTPLSNPFTPAPGVDPFFYVTGGFFKITVTKGALSRVYRDVAIGTAAGSDSPPVIHVGTWSGGTAYDYNNIVDHDGSSYIARSPSTNVEPGVAPGWETYWGLVAEKGVDGVDGVDALAGGALQLPELSSAPSAPAAGILSVYAKPDHKVYRKDSGGTEAEIGTGRGGPGVPVADYGAIGDGVTDDTTSINNALAAAASAGAGTVWLEAKTYLITNALDLPANVDLRGSGPKSVIKLSESSSFDGISAAGSVPTTTTISGTPARGALSFSLASATGFSVGDYISVEITENAAPNNYFGFITQIVDLAGAVVTSSIPLPFGVGGSDTTVVRKLSLIEGIGLHDLAIDVSANTGATTRGALLQYLINAHVSGVTVMGCDSNAGFYANFAFNSTFENITAYTSGNANESDITIRMATQCAIRDVKSFRANGFGPQFQYAAYNTIQSVISQNASIGTSRGVKFNGALFNDVSAVIGNNSQSTGIAISLGSSHNTFRGVQAVSNIGAASGNRVGIWLSDQKNINNVIMDFVAMGSGDYDIYVGTSDTGNMFVGGIIGNETLVYNAGDAKFFNVNGAAMISNVSGSGSGPAFVLKRNNASPTAFGNIGYQSWTGTVTGGAQGNFGNLLMVTPDVGASTYQGRLSYQLAKNGAASDRFLLDPDFLAPASDNAIANGQGSLRWSVVYAGTGTINTSDARDKTILGDIPQIVLDAVMAVPLQMFQWNDAIDEKGVEQARVHFGPMAQDVEQAFSERGIDPHRWALFCRDDLVDYKTGMPILDSEGQPAYRLGLRLDQFDRLRMEAIRRRLLS